MTTRSKSTRMKLRNYFQKRSLSVAAFFLVLTAGCFLAHQVSSAQTKNRGTRVVGGDDQKPVQLYAQSWALVIGVRKYTNGWPELNGAAEDVIRVKDSLEKQGFNVETLPDPTRDTFNQTLERFINEHGSTGSENNRLVIYFAGHGETLKNPDGRQLGFIVPSDAPLPQQNEREFRRLAISMDKIEGYAREILAKHVLFIFDSCFAGSLFEAVRRAGPSALIIDKAAKPVRQFITAGTEKQTVPDNSIFCDQFIKALNGAADFNTDGYITGEELGMFLHDKVSNYSNRTQTPRYGKIRDERLDQGDVVFINPATQALQPSGTALPRLEMRSEQLRSVEASAFSNDGRLIILGDADNAIHMWDLIAGKEIGRFIGHTAPIETIAFSPDARLVASSAKDHTVRVWDVATRKELRTFNDCVATPQSIAISPDGRQLLMAAVDQFARVFDINTGLLQLQLKMPIGPISGVFFSPNGSSTLAIGANGEIVEWELASGKQINRRNTGSRKLELLALSQDQKIAALVDAEAPQIVQLINLETNEPTRSLSAHGEVRSVTFSPDGKSIVAGARGCPDRNTVIWDLASGIEVMRLPSQSDSINTVSFSPSSRFALTAGSSGVATLWDVTTGNEIARLITFRNGPWAVVTAEGRFDTSDFEENFLYWLSPDNPLKQLPLSIFAREFYEPDLLSRTLAGEKFQPIPPLNSLNTVLPTVKITRVDQGTTPDRVTITVEARNGTEMSNSAARESGINNLRLFRDGQLVGQQDGELKSDNDGRALFTFTNIGLPRNSARQVNFSAYAFNSDRIKSATAKYSFVLPQELQPQKGRAYIIAMGVNNYDTVAFNLRFTVNDVVDLTGALSQALRKVDDYAEVIPISLISDKTSKQATKQNLATVFSLLAGKKPDARMLANIRGAEKLRRATPDDLVIVYLSGHGYADKASGFYFVPSDIGQVPTRGSSFGNEITKRFVSSNELALWLRDIDAGDSALIIDSSSSGAALKTFESAKAEELTLKQLAYDKSLKVLTASQADTVAIESAQLSHSLLAYSLIEGLTKKAADFKPLDGVITLSEWLGYAVERVPTVLDEVRSEKRKSGRGTAFDIIAEDFTKSRPAQQRPLLFDSGQKRSDVILVRTALPQK